MPCYYLHLILLYQGWFFCMKSNGEFINDWLRRVFIQGIMITNYEKQLDISIDLDNCIFIRGGITTAIASL